MAVNRQAMLTNVFKSSGQIAFGPFPTGVALSDTTVATPPYDTARATALLEAAGWKRGPDGVRMKNGQPTGEYEDFMTGFVVDNASVWGRPAGVAVTRDGALLVSDDANGTIFRVMRK